VEPDFMPSKLGFGGAAIGLRNYMGPYDAGSAAAIDSAIAAIRQAVALGMTYFDTAPSYGDGLSERIMGEALDGLSERVFLAKKVWPGSPGGARASLEASLTMVNPANTFDYTPALIQFVLSNRLVDVALVGMRIIREVESCVGIWKDESGRIDIDALWRRFISDQKINA
jgi:aryl-alcohol dehydrogenase-like predicted oxidoreductase